MTHPAGRATVGIVRIENEAGRTDQGAARDDSVGVAAVSGAG